MSMVVCVQCKRVIWAYDHEPRPISGLLNGLNMVCPKCGGVRSFDGYDGNLSWEQMHTIADTLGYSWEADGECRWFGDVTDAVAGLCKVSPLTREVLQKMFEELGQPEGDDRYDAAHPESEHDGGLGSGDRLKEAEVGA